MSSPGPGPGLGGWAPEVSFAGPEWSDATADQREAALAVAVHTVWALSGRRFGVARVLLAPWVPYISPYRSVPQLAGYRPTDTALHYPFPGSSYDRARRILLPGPTVGVREVRIGGVPLPAEAWAADPDGRLTRVEGFWPAQNLWSPVFTVDYVRGTPVPAAANVAAGIYAIEWLKGHTGDVSCRLPSRVREVARAGVRTALAAPETLAGAGLTGIGEVDTFIAAANPALPTRTGRALVRSSQPGALWSPETSAHRVLSVGPA